MNKSSDNTKPAPYQLCIRGNEYLADHDYKNALYCYEVALEQMPHDENALFGKAEALSFMGNKKDALENYISSARIAWSSTKHYFCTDSLYKLDQYELQIKCSEKALYIEPDNIETWFLKSLGHGELAVLYYQMKNYSDAIKQMLESLKCIEKCIELDPQRAELLNNKGTLHAWLGLFHIKLGNDHEAARCFESAIGFYDKSLQQFPNSLFILLNKLHALEFLDRELDYKQCANLITNVENNKKDEYYNSFDYPMTVLGKSEIGTWEKEPVMVG